MTDNERETFIRNNRWIVNVDTAFLFRRLDDARHRTLSPQAEFLTMLIEARADERRKAATVARCRVPPEMADYIEHQVLTGGTG